MLIFLINPQLWLQVQRVYDKSVVWDDLAALFLIVEILNKRTDMNRSNESEAEC